MNVYAFHVIGWQNVLNLEDVDVAQSGLNIKIL